MKITYDKTVNAVYIKFTDLPITDTREDDSGNIYIDYALDNTIVGIEILNASAKISQPDIAEHKLL
jgi:uncharacterized protein YuzE